jgi:prolipoprotein diacylglyceryltransferase
MILPAPQGHGYYSTCYLLAVLTIVLVALFEGQRRGFQRRPWLVLLACWLLAFIVGTKLITLPFTTWPAALLGPAVPTEQARSVLGGALSGGLMVLVLRRWLGFGWQVFDALALPLCAGLVVQCVGCLLTGCCFGELSTTGLVYAAGTPPWWAQVSEGLIPATATQALPVVPTQIYSLLLCLGTGSVLWLTRHRAWPVGSWLLLQTGLLLLGRFSIEFWRHPASEPVAAQPFTMGGVTMLTLQWLLLPLALLALAAWAWQVSRPALSRPAAAQAGGTFQRLLAVVGLLLLTALLGPGVLTLPEVLVVKALLLAMLVLEGAALLRGKMMDQQPQSRRPVALTLQAAAGWLLLTSQTSPTVAPPAASAGNEPTQSLTLTLGGRQGQYDELSADETGCGSSGYRAIHDHSYRVGGGSWPTPSTRKPMAHLTPSALASGRARTGWPSTCSGRAISRLIRTTPRLANRCSASTLSLPGS